MSSCSSSASGVAGITSSGLGGAVGAGGGSSLLSVSDSSSGTVIALTRKRLSLGKPQGSQAVAVDKMVLHHKLLGCLLSSRSERSIQLTLFYHNPDRTDHVQTI